MLPAAPPQHNETLQKDGDVIVSWIKDVVAGMNYLHLAKPPVLHNDLKARRGGGRQGVWGAPFFYVLGRSWVCFFPSLNGMSPPLCSPPTSW